MSKHAAFHWPLLSALRQAEIVEQEREKAASQNYVVAAASLEEARLTLEDARLTLEDAQRRREGVGTAVKAGEDYLQAHLNSQSHHASGEETANPASAAADTDTSWHEELVALLSGAGELRVAQIYTLVHATRPTESKSNIRSQLSRLSRQGKIERVRQGVYRALSTGGSGTMN
ncbi:hypothetical protein ACPCDX_23790 [Streptomyces koyangensis]|uniref:hypothetical protein n=1 Tax=Streptomyces koyangensis TaxID=188770 RepID=UPI003C2ACC24